VFPITRLLELEEEDYIGSVAMAHLSFMGYIPNPSGLPATIDSTVDLLAEDDVNLALFTPADLLSHQTMAIIQRAVEAAGISTISVALCKDVVDVVGVPRAVHYRFPFGYTFGDPNDETMQLRILKETLRASTEIEEAGTVVELPYQWLEL
jgi:D-proline reductase (dithiol) PrdB